jgi:hypothetical protein
MDSIELERHDKLWGTAHWLYLELVAESAYVDYRYRRCAGLLCFLILLVPEYDFPMTGFYKEHMINHWHLIETVYTRLLEKKQNGRETVNESIALSTLYDLRGLRNLSDYLYSLEQKETLRNKTMRINKDGSLHFQRITSVLKEHEVTLEDKESVPKGTEMTSEKTMEEMEALKPSYEVIRSIEQIDDSAVIYEKHEDSAVIDEKHEARVNQLTGRDSDSNAENTEISKSWKAYDNTILVDIDNLNKKIENDLASYADDPNMKGSDDEYKYNPNSIEPAMFRIKEENRERATYGQQEWCAAKEFCCSSVERAITVERCIMCCYYVHYNAYEGGCCVNFSNRKLLCHSCLFMDRTSDNMKKIY